MKCINKWMALLLCICIGCSFSGCKSETIPQEYEIYESSYQYGITKNAPLTSSNLFSENLCIAKDENIHNDEVDSQVAKSAAVFNTTTLETLYAQNIYEKIYPASTTKILTALCAIKYGDLDQVITVSENACDMASDSSVCKLKPGDQLTLRQLLYGLLLRSGNDAAIAIAEGISGDVASFAKLMNQEANSLGATHSNFVNPNGLQDKNHYTCAYDMYLIFHAAVAEDEFVDIIHSSNYDAYYKDISGNPVEQKWTTTNQYVNGFRSNPDGITVIGGKTGTTGEAGYCLVLYSQNANHEPLISMVYGADCRGNLYLLMNEILSKYGNQ